jgi:hypothetical protein
MSHLIAYFAVVLELCKRSSSLTRIPDLSAIPRTKIISLVATKQLLHPLHHLFLVESDPSLPGQLDPLKVDAPDLQSLLFIELLIVQGDVDARFEGFVEGPDLVCCQEQDARVVFQHSKEDRNDCVPREITISSTRLQEDIRFIQQHDTAPSMRQLETLAEILLDFLRIVSNVT